MGTMVAYKELARYYDLIYREKDYKKESRDMEKLVRKYKRSKGNELLDVACGTGKHLTYLKNKFSCMGVDINKEMLEVARLNAPGVNFRTADMLHLNLNRKFDVIICLFSAIGYVRTYSNLRRAIRNLHKHLNPGGVLIIDGWLTKEQWKNGHVHMATYNAINMKIARVGYSGLKGNISILNEHYLVAEKDKGVRHFKDRQELGLFDTDKFLSILDESGFKSKVLRNALGIRNRYVAVKT